MATENLGIVKAIHVGVSAPSQTDIIWKDTNSNKLKYYNTLVSEWQVLRGVNLKTVDPGPVYEADFNEYDAYVLQLSEGCGLNFTGGNVGQTYRIKIENNTFSLSINEDTNYVVNTAYTSGNLLKHTFTGGEVQYGIVQNDFTSSNSGDTDADWRADIAAGDIDIYITLDDGTDLTNTTNTNYYDLLDVLVLGTKNYLIIPRYQIIG